MSDCLKFRILSIVSICALLFTISCNKETKEQVTVNDSNTDKNFISFAIKTDIVPRQGKEKIFIKLDSITNGLSVKDKALYRDYMKYALSKKDSSDYYLSKIDTVGRSVDVRDLIELYTFKDGFKSDAIGPKITEAIFKKISSEEKRKSPLLFKYYDLMAQAFYINKNIVKSTEYFKLSFDNNPEKNTASEKIKYYEVLFLYAMESSNIKEMEINQKKAEHIARQEKNEYELSRTMDYKAIIYGLKKMPDSGVYYSKKSFQYLESTNRLNPVAFINLAINYQGNKEFDSAIKYSDEGIKWSVKHKDSSGMAEFYAVLSDAYKGKGDYKNSLKNIDTFYKLRLKNINDIQKDKVYEIEQKFKSENKDLTISSLKTKNKLNNRIILQQKWLMFIVGATFLLGGFVLYNFLKRKNLQSRAERLLVENDKLKLEQKTFQLKISPHFIFNTVSNLQGLISEKETTKSISYLTKFARLMRNILEFEKEDFISIEDEIRLLEDYMQLQQMRFKTSFEYSITVDDNIEPYLQLIPPMLLQPFVENSIVHGFGNIDYIGKINIIFENKTGNMEIIIQDNGRGEAAQNVDGNKQSLSTSITRQRLKVLFPKTNSYVHTMAQDNGFRVEISIPIITEE
ncbi:sensor histidine kinase [Elizabethkingia anophelis]|uniref:Histidine kinase n=1 Tax=Elizabethkingia anophelis TaxID=1117645 RepID=A0A494J8S1_9FLAO|nr:histidine kinase [Elizabethkingia anophelis]AQX51303.1 histidine kinase [Elizabethkingia anophelis]MCT4196711.1 histidine kinase [Elizabethkingia anophelis]MCT4225345.1 histidine kinase [Elizabethkingia anophelis]MCT4306936.1 histidine kinase [Elizabethkingia anophelis]MDV2472695.1 histidine kinase [Elizabethkingia anophelis]